VHAVLGKIAVAGDSFSGGRAKWTVEKVKGRRIETIRLTSEQPWPDEVLVSAGLLKEDHVNRGDGQNGDRTGRSAREEETGHLS
jgi:hypothetical protein